MDLRANSSASRDLLFVNGVTVKFGDHVVEPVESNEDSIQLRISKNGTMVVVDIIVITDAGESNGVSFMSSEIKELYGTISLKEIKIKTILVERLISEISRC